MTLNGQTVVHSITHRQIVPSNKRSGFKRKPLRSILTTTQNMSQYRVSQKPRSIRRERTNGRRRPLRHSTDEGLFLPPLTCRRGTSDTLLVLVTLLALLTQQSTNQGFGEIGVELGSRRNEPTSPQNTATKRCLSCKVAADTARVEHS